VNVTIYTDASWNEQSTGVAYWCRSDLGRLVGSKGIATGIANVQEAEALAVLFALRAVKASWPGFHFYIINVDNSSVIGALRQARPLSTDMGRKIISTCRMYLGHQKCSVKHVKAHTKGTDVRSYLNDQCDRLSKQARRQSLILTGGISSEFQDQAVQRQ